jgi:hypothetical protein
LSKNLTIWKISDTIYPEEKNFGGELMKKLDYTLETPEERN